MQLHRDYASQSSLLYLIFHYPRTESWAPGTSERATRNYLIVIDTEDL